MTTRTLDELDWWLLERAALQIHPHGFAGRTAEQRRDIVWSIAVARRLLRHLPALRADELATAERELAGELVEPPVDPDAARTIGAVVEHELRELLPALYEPDPPPLPPEPWWLRAMRWLARRLYR